MRHIILFLPSLMRPVWRRLSLVRATPLYLYVIAWALSLWLYWSVLRPMRRHGRSGPKLIVSRHGSVKHGEGGSLMVRIHDQFGKAAANDTLRGADEIRAIGRHGRLVRVSRDIPGLSEPKHTEGT